MTIARARWVRHALTLRPALPMWFLLPFRFPLAKGRLDLVDKLVKVWAIPDRGPRMHRDGWKGKKAPPKKNYCWFLFDGRHRRRMANQTPATPPQREDQAHRTAPSHFGPGGLIPREKVPQASSDPENQ